MTDAVEYVEMTGGLDEETSNAKIRPGAVRSSLNYELYPNGGYGLMKGTVRYSGGIYTPREDAIQVVSATKHSTSVALAQLGGIFGKTIKYQVLGAIQRDLETLVVVQLINTDKDLYPGYRIYAECDVIESYPELTEEEIERVTDTIQEFAESNAEKVSISSPVYWVGGSENYLYAVVKLSDEALQIKKVHRSRPPVLFDGPAIPTNVWTTAAVLLISSEEYDYDSMRWRGVIHAFPGQEEGLYLVNGLTLPYVIYTEQDATTWNVTEIDDTTDEPPTHVTVHENHLFYGYASGSVIHSELLSPTSFDGVGGAAEFKVAGPVTGFQELPGRSMAIYTENSIHVLSGTSAANWELSTHSLNTGALTGTAQDMPEPIFCDRRGITTFGATSKYGDFSAAMISHNFKRTYDRIVSQAVQDRTDIEPQLFSAVNRRKSQYIVINEFGRGLRLTFNNRSMIGALEFDIGENVSSIGIMGDDIFIGTADGEVLLFDWGNRLNTRRLDGYLQLSPMHYGSPRQKKRFKQIVMDVRGDHRADIRVKNYIDRSEYYHEIGEGSPVEIIRNRDFTGYNIDEQRYRAMTYLHGTGFDQTIEINSSKYPHVIESMAMHYIPRGQRR